MALFRYSRGAVPLLMSIPHVGTEIPEDIRTRLTPPALALEDTDWHLDRLYGFAGGLGLSILQARTSRYVIDLNRPPDDEPLYPGARNTELVPLTTFGEEAIYKEGAVPDAAEVAARRARFWQPYHDRLAAELAALRERHGLAVLFDCHSIKSEVPRFFEGVLPDFNLGTADGESCDPSLRDRLAAALAAHDRYSLAVDGRFKGGYITRRYGRPAEGVHAFQLELALKTYMDETPPFALREELARQLRPALQDMLAAALAWAGSQAG